MIAFLILLKEGGYKKQRQGIRVGQGIASETFPKQYEGGYCPKLPKLASIISCQNWRTLSVAKIGNFEETKVAKIGKF